MYERIFDVDIVFVTQQLTVRREQVFLFNAVSNINSIFHTNMAIRILFWCQKDQSPARLGNIRMKRKGNMLSRHLRIKKYFYFPVSAFDFFLNFYARFLSFSRETTLLVKKKGKREKGKREKEKKKKKGRKKGRNHVISTLTYFFSNFLA